MINLNYYKITSNSDACNVFKHFKELENKLEEIYIRYETAYHKGPYYDRITIFFDKHFDSFCKREFFYHRICLNKYRLDNIKKYKWQTTNFTFKINLSKIYPSLFKTKYISYLDIANSKEENTYKLVVIYPNYKTAKIEFERLYTILTKLPEKDVLEIIFRNEEKRINNMNSIAFGF